MNPDDDSVRATDPAIAGVLAELIEYEPIFHRPEKGTTRADFEKMTSADFWEVGASGRCYGRPWILDELERRYAVSLEDVWEATGFRCQRLAQDVYLLTYTLTQDNKRRTRRSTIWERSNAGWKILFHQGTIIQDADP
jgi:hypothetical protein